MTDDLDWIVGLELALLRPDVRGDRATFGDLLHPDFVEIGASGRRWTRDEIIEFAHTDIERNVQVTDMNAREITRGVVLVTFTTTTGQRRSLRSSVWVGAGRSWTVIHHQGTPTPS